MSADYLSILTEKPVSRCAGFDRERARKSLAWRKTKLGAVAVPQSGEPGAPVRGGEPVAPGSNAGAYRAAAYWVEYAAKHAPTVAQQAALAAVAVNYSAKASMTSKLVYGDEVAILTEAANAVLPASAYAFGRLQQLVAGVAKAQEKVQSSNPVYAVNQGIEDAKKAMPSSEDWARAENIAKYAAIGVGALAAVALLAPVVRGSRDEIVSTSVPTRTLGQRALRGVVKARYDQNEVTTKVANFVGIAKAATVIGGLATTAGVLTLNPAIALPGGFVTAVGIAGIVAGAENSAYRKAGLVDLPSPA